MKNYTDPKLYIDELRKEKEYIENNYFNDKIKFVVEEIIKD